VALHAIIGALLVANPAAAQSAPTPDTVFLGLAEVRAWALGGSPTYLAETARVGIAEGALREAGTFRFNPEAEAEFPGSLNGEGAGAYELLLTQRLEWAGQRGLRRDAARAALDGAGSSLAEAGRALLEGVTEAYYTGLAADRRLAVAEEVSELNQRLLEAVLVQLEEGEISVLEANFAQIEAARSLANVLAAAREAHSASLALSRLVGAPEGTVIRAVESSPEELPDAASMTLERLVSVALERRPDLSSRGHRLRQSEMLARLARRERLPDLGVGALVSGGEAEPSPRVGVQLSVSLPLWNRDQGVVAQREAQVRSLGYELAATELSVRTEVADALQAYAVASEEEVLLRERVLDPARSNQQLLDAAYREGQIDLPSLVLLRNQLRDAEVEYWDAWLARRRSLSRLYAAVGDFTVDLEAE
jgi:cobalt-zinc-cadmium efflux system outer membrane protein